MIVEDFQGIVDLLYLFARWRCGAALNSFDALCCLFGKVDCGWMRTIFFFYNGLDCQLRAFTFVGVVVRALHSFIKR